MQRFSGTSVIVSPHCDDSILSLGGTILSGLFEELRVIDVFATNAWAADESKYGSHVELTNANRAEEIAVMKTVGAKVTLLSFPEALLRGYRKWNTLYRHSTDTQLRAEVLQTVSDDIYSANNVFFPLANGNHVDHVLVYKLLDDLYAELNKRGIQIYIYEDVPYSWWIEPTPRLKRVQQVYTMEPLVIDITSVLEQKESALRMYESQIDEDEIRRAREYARSMVSGQYSERLWRIQK